MRPLQAEETYHVNIKATQPIIGWIERAEGEGFEPSWRLTPPTAFPMPRTRPDYATPPRVAAMTIGADYNVVDAARIHLVGKARDK